MRDPWQWQEGQHWHERDTNGEMYRCPLTDCWWNAQREPEPEAGS
jgi:hypothetical protein